MRSPNVRFVSHFIADIIDMDTYGRGYVPLSKVTSRNESLVVRVEDCLLDIFMEPFKEMITKDRSREQIKYSKVNTFLRFQGKRMENLRGMISGGVTPSQYLESPVFFPLYTFLADLATIDYPVTLLHDNPQEIEAHPVCSLLGFPIVATSRMHFHKDSILISPYAEEGPEYLFPRSFNQNDMDDIYTLYI